MEHYKSPLKKLVSFFEKSRNCWKAKALRAKKELKLSKNRIKFLEMSKAKLKQELILLKKERSGFSSETASQFPTEIHSSISENDKKNVNPIDFKKPLSRHHYSAQHIALWISLVLSAASRMRCASRIMKMVSTFFNFSIDMPTWHTARLWLMRLGYYKLNRPKEKHDDWIWIIDHSVQIGPEKCFVILGIRLKNLPQGRSLKYEDVEPIELVPVKKSNGDIVYEQLKKVTEKTGIPAEIISDHGPDLKTGIDRFCKKYDKTVSIYDIKHKMAAILKQVFEKDEDWLIFIGLCSQTKLNVQQTEMAHLAPPHQRSKARYMNVDVLITWGIKILHFIDQKKHTLLDSDKFKEKIGWITQYRDKIDEWNNLLNVISLSETFVRKQGLYYGADLELQKELDQLHLCQKSNDIKEKVLTFVKQESQKIGPEQRFLGSSEIIESLFGKQKMLEQEQSKSGFTGLILGIAALVAKTTVDVIEKAMETVKTKTVLDWVKENIKKSVQAKRNEVFSRTNRRNKNGTNNGAVVM